MPGRIGLHAFAMAWCFVLVSHAGAQSPLTITGQTIVDAGAAAGGALAPAWAGWLGTISETATATSLLRQGDYLGFAQLEVNARTVNVAQWAGTLVGGPAGGAIGASVTAAALDVGDLVIAPRLANALVAAFPGVFVPATTATVSEANPFGPQGKSAFNPTAATSANRTSGTQNVAIQGVPKAPVIPLGVSASTALSTGNTNSQSVSSLTGANLQGSNAWLVAMMNNPNNDLAERKIAAIALGVNPDVITAVPQATALLAALDPNAAKLVKVTPMVAGAGSQSGSISAPAPSSQSNKREVDTAPKANTQTTSGDTQVRTIVPGKPSAASHAAGSSSAGAVPAPPATPPPDKFAYAAPRAPVPYLAQAPARIAPGGISLSEAAAKRMPLNLTLDGAYIESGRIILGGRLNSKGGIDAALFMTALRAACENSDPYFSLDPDNVGTWLAEARQAEGELGDAIKRDTTWHFEKRLRPNTPSVLKFQTISASRDFPRVWNSLLTKYSNLRSRLVFQPEWLRQTRFGEIMYRADVLLKELAGGATALGETQFRAASIVGYRSATERIAAVRLLYRYDGRTSEQNAQAGGRIWYDLSESSDTVVGGANEIPQGMSELRSLLEHRELLTRPAQQSPPQKITENGGAIDLSDIYPRMYVRVRDPVTYRDSTARFPGLDELVAQANQTPERYAAVYSEYEQLVEVFRAYVVAVRAKQTQPEVCGRLPNELLDSEKVHSALPAYHPTDFAMTMAWYEYTDGRLRRAIGESGGLFQGGVAIGVNRLFHISLPNIAVTPVIKELKLQAIEPAKGVAWNGDDGRQYVALTFRESVDRTADAGSGVPPAPAAKTVVSTRQEQANSEPSPVLSGTSGRFDLYNDARVDGTKLQSATLRNEFSKKPGLAQDECASVCSGNADCIAFDIDEVHNTCATYSSVLGTHSEMKWMHGIWR